MTLITKAIATLPEADQQGIIAHELAHDKFPTLQQTEVARYLQEDSEQYNQLAAAAGKISSYAREFWYKLSLKPEYRDGVTLRVAIDESLAEVAMQCAICLSRCATIFTSRSPASRAGLTLTAARQ